MYAQFKINWCMYNLKAVSFDVFSIKKKLIIWCMYSLKAVGFFDVCTI